jgi:predicted aspartyl protease
LPDDPHEIAIRVFLDLRRFWLTVATDVGEGNAIDMVLDTGAPLSAVSSKTRDTLHAAGLIPTRTTRRFTLPNLVIDGHELGPVLFIVSERLSAVGVPALLGLNFFSRFKSVCFDVVEMRLRLTP